MSPVPASAKVWMAAGVSDTRNGFNGLAVLAETILKVVFGGNLFVFRGRRDDILKRWLHRAVFMAARKLLVEMTTPWRRDEA